MVRKPPSVVSLSVTAVLVAATVVWTLVVLHLNLVTPLDRWALRPPVRAMSVIGQIAAAVALITEPVLIYLSLLVMAVWAFRNRMRQLAGALLLMVVIGWGGGWLVRLLIARPRPADALPLITTSAYSYPGSHMIGVTIGVIAIGSVLVITRRHRVTQVRWSLLGLVILVAVAVDRWLLAAHYLSDLIGGVLFGAAVAAISLVIAGVSVLPPFVVQPVAALAARRAVEPPEASRSTKRCAVIYNPARVSDWPGFRRSIAYETRTRGWEPPIWLETTVDDPGRGAARRAIDSNVDLVVAAGGDGTVRLVAAEMAESGIPFGVIPAGTGNLLAKNLGIPLDERVAMEVAFSGRVRQMDVVRVIIDDERADHFVVMAGIGMDATIMQDTNPDLKRAVGSVAYFLAAARNANHPALHATITVDDGEPMRRRAHVVVIGNVGYLPANIPLIPDAKPDDGLLDLLIASPRNPTDWPRLIARVVARRDRAEGLERMTGSKVRIEVAEGDNFELDGDPAGRLHTMTAEVLAGALSIRVPR